IVGASVATYGVTLLLDALRASNSALTSGTGPNIGGSPLPPPLNPDQANGAAQQGPAVGIQIPRLEDILRNAGHPPQEGRPRNYDREGARPRNGRHQQNSRERRHQRRAERRAAAERAAAQAAAQTESPAPPVCPPGIIVVAPDMSRFQKQYQLSQTRQMLQRDTTSGLCTGETPRIIFRSPGITIPRYQCQDVQTGRGTSGELSTDPNLQCAPGEVLEQISGLRLSNWGKAARSACDRIRHFGGADRVVLEGTNIPKDRGMQGDAAEQAALDAEIRSSCPDSIPIYSEEPAFAGASDWAQNRIFFNATPADILQGRGRNTNAEQEAAQEEMQSQTEDGAQGAGSSPAQDGQPNSKPHDPE
ncbi:MAG: hypothetical protein ACRC1U_09005, partial [Vibrionaceae bacterium]